MSYTNYHSTTGYIHIISDDNKHAPLIGIIPTYIMAAYAYYGIIYANLFHW